MATIAFPHNTASDSAAPLMHGRFDALERRIAEILEGASFTDVASDTGDCEHLSVDTFLATHGPLTEADIQSCQVFLKEQTSIVEAEETETAGVTHTHETYHYRTQENANRLPPKAALKDFAQFCAADTANIARAAFGIAKRAPAIAATAKRLPFREELEARAKRAWIILFAPEADVREAVAAPESEVPTITFNMRMWLIAHESSSRYALFVSNHITLEGLARAAKMAFLYPVVFFAVASIFYLFGIHP